MPTLELNNIADANYTGESSDLTIETFNECQRGEWSHYDYNFTIIMGEYEPMEFQKAKGEKSYSWTLSGNEWEDDLKTGFFDMKTSASNEAILTEAIRQAHAFICNQI